MKNSIAIWLFCLCMSLPSFSQPYGNEWVDFDKSYLKVTLNATGMYRIPYSTLVNYYDPSELIGSDFQLFGRGQEVAIYVSTNGLFDNDDYVEFIRGVDVLFHECNFRDQQSELARITGHSCTTNVCEVAKAAAVSKLVLIHINPLETGDDPVGLANARSIFPQTILGQDEMVIQL